ncbi:LysR family transcriptional regulator [Yersinia enterocolitica]|uniref:LysR family transcriptional regulator n=1 Tax=Yersinia enterocolitica TaxID=630 RepID=UPI0029B31EDA|nr:LysR family transcriptional regulator [Yersinia enterocolitica]EKN6243667.1 LysR family transcriptional regulator [Yersinia enterocolitica]HDL7859056.1 LysR family transcriptional regulator [Yersinia enterocolitica]HEI6795118.1 LysR family transcriptional regulator [Yersinia enterocolitica]HEN3588556.1 LysR family transcriptional regulator [Yersinia enterocolitica]
MNSFSHIPIFIAVVDAGSFSGAAIKLNMTKSAVSKRISQFEDELGVRLLYRTTRSLSLTEAGLKYYDYARTALQLAKEGEDAITQMQDTPQGVLRISVPMAFGRLHISPLIPGFLSQNPGVEINMVMDDRVVNLVEGGFDMGIRIGQLADSAMIARPLSPCSSVLCASPAYLQRHGTPLLPNELREHNCLFYSYFLGGTEWIFNGKEGGSRFLPKGNYQVNNSEALYDALLAGLGICQMPKFIVGPALADGRLLSILPNYLLPKHSIYAIYPQRLHIPAKMRAFLDYLLVQFGANSAYRQYYEN